VAHLDPFSPKSQRWVFLALAALALGYALLAGLRTVGDFDTGWQLAGGRYIVENRAIPSTEVHSYTAPGAPWIYPAGSQALLYLLYLAGGFAALSWLNAATCAATIALLLRAGGVLTAFLAVIAVPGIAHRTVPRADLFTTVLFAAFLLVVWRHYRGQPAPLWTLPVLMAAWVNLHLGFIAGLGLLAAYAGMEALELPFAARRAAALARLKAAAPWMLAAAAATLLNPWGWWNYTALARQGRVMEQHAAFIGEWSGVNLSAATLAEALDWRNPESGYWWLLLAAAAGCGVSLWRGRLGPALLLAGTSWYSLAHVRFQGLFALVTVVVAGSLLSEPWRTEEDAAEAGGGAPRAPSRVAYVALAVALLLGVVRVADLASNRYYLASGQLSLCGAGASWWFPEDAAAFLLREKLPGNVFSDYNLGGYLSFRIGPQYRSYLDGRAVPFGPERFTRQRQLMNTPPDSPEWDAETERWQINTLIFSVARYAGLGSIPLQQFCRSRNWRPVYLDHAAVIFVRQRPENEDWIRRLAVDCATVPFSPPAAIPAGPSSRAAAELYHFHMNTASIAYVLGRDRDAAGALDRAERIFYDDSNLHLLKAQLFQANNRTAEAKVAYLASLQLRATDAAWHALGRLYIAERNYAEAARCLEEAARISQQPYDRWVTLGQLYAALNRQHDALAAFARAEAASPYRGDSETLGPEFYARIAEGRGRVWRARGDAGAAIVFFEQAVARTPQSPARWTLLAEAYLAAGLREKAQEALARAQAATQATTPQP